MSYIQDDNLPCCSKYFRDCTLYSPPTVVYDLSNLNHNTKTNKSELRKGKSTENLLSLSNNEFDNKTATTTHRTRSYSSLEGKSGGQTPGLDQVNNNHDFSLIDEDNTKRLNDELALVLAHLDPNHKDNNNLNSSSKDKSKKSSSTTDFPTLPPMVDLLREKHGELIKRLIETHDELTRLKRLEQDRPPSKPSKSWWKFRQSKVEVPPPPPEKVIPQTKFSIGRKRCEISTTFPMSLEKDICIMSFYNTDEYIPSEHFTSRRIETSSIEILPDKDFHAQLYEDVKNMNEITLLDSIDLDEAYRVSTSCLPPYKSSLARLMNYIEIYSSDDIIPKPTTSLLEPIETLMINARTMRHLLLYTNPKYDVTKSKVLPPNVTGKSMYHPTIYDKRCYIPPGIAATCFPDSEIDLELKTIFKRVPPVTHKLYTKRVPRRKRDSSVANVDSIGKRKDIARFGHASYFIPMLKPTQRQKIGWKATFRLGKRKYHNNLFKSNIDRDCLTYCQMMDIEEGPLDPNVSTSPSLESFEKGPRVYPMVTKEVNKRTSFLSSNISLPISYKQTKWYWFERLRHRLLPCWWVKPPFQEEAEPWKYVQPNIFRRGLEATCGCCMENKVESFHDIITSESGSGEFVTKKPTRIMYPVKPGPRHRDTYLLPKPSPPPFLHPSPTTNHYYYDADGNLMNPGKGRVFPSPKPSNDDDWVIIEQTSLDELLYITKDFKKRVLETFGFIPKQP